MYQIDPASKRISPLTVKSFSELGFTERYDLQEWISHEPESLGELIGDLKGGIGTQYW